MRNTSSGTIRTSCSICALVWLEQQYRFCGVRLRETSRTGFVPNCGVEKGSKGESLQKLYQDVCRLISLAYSGELSALSDIVGRHVFLEALDDHAMRMRILKKELKNLDDSTNLAASRLAAFDIMRSTGPQTDKNKPKCARAATGGGIHRFW